MRKMIGSGLPDVFLVNGVVAGPEGSVAYRELDGLYAALADAIAARGAVMTPQELRFLRKRLGMTQEEVGRLGGKTGQVAAMWEKGMRPVPAAESHLLRLLWMARHARRGLAAAVLAIRGDAAPADGAPYVLRYDAEGGWSEHAGPVRRTSRRDPASGSAAPA